MPAMGVTVTWLSPLKRLLQIREFVTRLLEWMRRWDPSRFRR